MQIRLARENDLETLVDLWIELMEYHTSFGPSFLINKNKRAAIEALMREMISKKHTRIFVMETEGQIIAMLIARIDLRPEMFIHHKLGYIAETIVSNIYKGKSIGSELVDAAHVWFKSENVAYTELQVAEANHTSVSFWKSKGYETQLLRMISIDHSS